MRIRKFNESSDEGIDIRDIKDEYIIINRTVLEKRIEELKQSISKCILPEQQHLKDLLEQEVEIKVQILSQSTPLIHEIEKAFDAGQEFGTNMTLFYNTDKISRVEFESTFDKEEYISNLKLDIC